MRSVSFAFDELEDALAIHAGTTDRFRAGFPEDAVSFALLGGSPRSLFRIVEAERAPLGTLHRGGFA